MDGELCLTGLNLETELETLVVGVTGGSDDLSGVSVLVSELICFFNRTGDRIF